MLMCGEKETAETGKVGAVDGNDAGRHIRTRLYLARESTICRATASSESLEIRAEDRGEMLPSGAQAVFKNRIGWAHDRLKRAKLSSSPRRGFWKLTPEGHAFASKHKTLSNDELDRLASVARGSRLAVKKDGAFVAHPQETNFDTASPEERIETAVAELRESVGRAPPSFFEHVVLD
jgi:restriction system protein